MVRSIGTQPGGLELRCQPRTRHARHPRANRATNTVRRTTPTTGRGVAIETRAAIDRAAMPHGAEVAGWASMASMLPGTPAKIASRTANASERGGGNGRRLVALYEVRGNAAGDKGNTKDEDTRGFHRDHFHADLRRLAHAT